MPTDNSAGPGRYLNLLVLTKAMDPGTRNNCGCCMEQPGERGLKNYLINPAIAVFQSNNSTSLLYICPQFNIPIL